MSEITEVKERNKKEILSKPGVIGMGIGKDAIIVYLDEDMLTPIIPSELEGYPVKLVKTKKFEFY